MIIPLITLTEEHSTSIEINANHIAILKPVMVGEKMGSKIELVNGKSCFICETVEEIKKMLGWETDADKVKVEMEFHEKFMMLGGGLKRAKKPEFPKDRIG